MYYECHITLDLTPMDMRRAVESFNGWTYSAISGDPDFGQSLFCYATRRVSAGHDLMKVIDNMAQVAAALKLCGGVVLRQKVELVMYDTKALTANTEGAK